MSKGCVQIADMQLCVRPAKSLELQLRSLAYPMNALQKKLAMIAKGTFGSTKRLSPFFCALVMLLPLRSGHAAAPVCHGPQELEQQVREQPSARSWGALGGWYGEQKKFTCAVQAFQAAIRLDPGSALMHYFLGLTLYSSGQVDASIPELRKATAMDANSVQAQLALGVALHQQGHAAEAEAAWEAALAIDPNSVTALDWLAKARISEGQFGAAIELLSAAPRDEDLTLDLALAYSQSGQFDKAAKALEGAVAKTPGSVRLASALATVYVQSHRYQDATTLMRKTSSEYPADFVTELLYLRLLVLQDDDADAQPIAEKLLAAHPRDFDVLYLTGVTENDMQQYDAAVTHLKAAAELNPNHFDTRFNLGMALSHLKQNEAARDQLERAVALDSSNAEAHFHLAQVLRALGDTAGAGEQLKLFQQRQQATTTLALGQTKSGQAAQALDSGQTVQAIALYREAITALPQDAVLHYNLALALDQTGDFAAEQVALETAVRLRPRFAEAENQLGIVLAREGRDSVAEEHFRAAIAAAPSYAEAANNLGTLLGQQGHDQEAERFFRVAVTMNPRYVRAWTNLAATLASESRFAQARAAIDNALKIDPGDADALHLRAMLSESGNSSQPVSAAPDAASTNPRHD